MIPAEFEYARPSTVAEAVDALVEHGEDAKLLAGGHSLLPLMKLRLAYPAVLVDVARLDELRGVRTDGDSLVIGAATPHHEVASHPLVREHCGVVAEVARTIGDPQVRHRGTFGGAIAHGDAAGDLPAVVLALEGTIIAQGPGGQRAVPAHEFFEDYLETALRPDEVLVEVRLPILGQEWGWRYEKFTRVAQAWAVVGSCAVVRRDNGSIAEARVGLTNMATVPIRARAAEGVLGSGGGIREAAALAAEGTDPQGDQNATPAFRQHLARVLTERALQSAVG